MSACTELPVIIRRLCPFHLLVCNGKINYAIKGVNRDVLCVDFLKVLEHYTENSKLVTVSLKKGDHIKVHGQQLECSDLQTLTGSGWLNDKVTQIALYLKTNHVQTVI